MSELLAVQQDFTETAVLESDPTVLPIGEAILKIHSRCNLNCGYCYVYNGGDNGYLEQPREMSNETVDIFADRLAEYLDDKKPLTFAVTFHGGEPLLRSPKFLERTTRTLRAAVTSPTVLQFNMQTNGVLLDEKHMDVLRRNRITVGISLDGDQLANDRHRLNHAGKSSYDDVVRGIRQFDDHRCSHLFGGILSVVDLENDPLKTYRTLLEFDPPSIDFLLPHGNWQTPPPGLETREKREEAPYADWMNAIFDEWYFNDRRRTSVRYFESIIQLSAGHNSIVETIGGLASGGLIVVESDGSFELVDTLKSAPGMTYKTGRHVRKNSLEEANQYMANQARRMGATTLADACRGCDVLKQCGGGYTPHRFNQATKFAERSVYCIDLMQIIYHVQSTVVSLQREIRNRKRLEQNFPEPSANIVGKTLPIV